MYRKYILLFVISFIFSFPAVAQESGKPFVLNNTQVIPIESKLTGRKHELVVVLPATYAANPTKRYPVLYYMDAYWDTPLLVSTYGNLIYDSEVPEFIMVGLSYPSDTSYDKERLLDYTPTITVPGSGKSRLFLDFIQQEVAPFIETAFRGDKTDRVISGNSLGGLLALTAAYSAPGFFSGIVAVSPAAGWDNNVLARLDDEYAASHKSMNARIFISYGTTEYAPFRDPTIAFQKQLMSRQYQQLNLMNYRMEGLNHTSVKGDGYVRGLMWVWQHKKPAGPSGLERAMTNAK